MLAELDHMIFGSGEVIVIGEASFDPVRKVVFYSGLVVPSIAEDDQGGIVSMSNCSADALRI